MSTKVTRREYDRARGVPFSGLQRLDVNSRALLNAVRRGKGFNEIARRFGIAKSTICYRLRRDFPEEYRRLRRNPTVIQHHAHCAAAFKAYEEEGSIRKAARRLGVPKTTVMSRVKFMEKVLGK